MSIIHIYSQKKLSRNVENQEINYNLFKNYKEFDILYGKDLVISGNDMKDNTNIEFKYSEPKKLMEIEKFLIEFFISIRPNIDIFFDPTREIKYFDYSLISIIEDILSKFKKNSIEQIIYIINLKLYENFIKLPKKSDTTTISNSHNNNNTPNFTFLILNKEHFLREYFKYAENENLMTKLESSFYRNKDYTIMLSKYDDNKDLKPEISNFCILSVNLVECSLDIIGKNLDRSTKKEEAKINCSSDYTLDQIMDGLESLKFKRTISSDGEKSDFNMLGTAKFLSMGKQNLKNQRVNSDKDLERFIIKTQPYVSKTAYPNNLKKVQMDSKVIAEVTEGNGILDSPDPEPDINKKDMIIFQTENNMNTKEQDILLVNENNDDNLQRLIMNEVKKKTDQFKAHNIIGIDSTISVKVNKEKLES
jgi:hypothetical protein